MIGICHCTVSGTWSPEPKQRPSHYVSALDGQVVVKLELHRESFELYVRFHYLDSPSLLPLLATFSFAFTTTSSHFAEFRTYLFATDQPRRQKCDASVDISSLPKSFDLTIHYDLVHEPLIVVGLENQPGSCADSYNSLSNDLTCCRGPGLRIPFIHAGE
jgi:hypothetical protein